MWLTLRYTGSADAPQRQILTPFPGRRKGRGWGMRDPGVAPPKNPTPESQSPHGVEGSGGVVPETSPRLNLTILALQRDFVYPTKARIQTYRARSVCASAVRRLVTRAKASRRRCVIAGAFPDGEPSPAPAPRARKRETWKRGLGGRRVFVVRSSRDVSLEYQEQGEHVPAPTCGALHAGHCSARPERFIPHHLQRSAVGGYHCAKSL